MLFIKYNLNILNWPERLFGSSVRHGKKRMDFWAKPIGISAGKKVSSLDYVVQRVPLKLNPL